MRLFRVQAIRLFTIFTLVVAPGHVSDARGQPATAGQAEQPHYIIEELVTQFRFEDDGSGLRILRSSILVKDQAGVSEWSTLLVPYRSAVETVSLRRLEVQKADGRRVTDSTRAVDDVAAGQIDSAILSDLQAKRIVVPALQPGDRLTFEAVVARSTALVPGHFWVDHRFTRRTVLKEIVEIDVPAARDVNVMVRTGSEDSSITSPRDRRVRRWTYEQAAPEVTDPATSGLAELLAAVTSEPDIRLSSFKDWNQLAAWFGGVIDRRSEPDEAVTKRARELTQGLATPEQRLEALFRFVSTGIRYISLAFGSGQLEPRPATQVLSTQYGDCKDKHVLLASLARAIGLDVRPVLISNLTVVDERFPSMASFDHVVSVRAAGDPAQWEWMDASPGILPSGALLAHLRNKRALLVESAARPGPTATFVTTLPALRIPQSLTIDVTGKIDGKGLLTTRVSRHVTGDAEFVMRLGLRDAGQEARTAVAKEAAGNDNLRNATITAASFKDAGPGRGVEFSYEATHPFGLTYDKPFQIWIPTQAIDLPEAPAGAKKIKLGERLDVVVRARYEVPPSVRGRPPVPVSLDREYATYRSTYTVDGQILNLERRLRTLASEVPIEQLESYRAFLKAVDADFRQKFSVEAITRPADTPVTADELNAAGYRAIEKRQFKEAVDLLERATEIDPNHKFAWNNLGRAYNSLDEYEKGREALERQIAINPFDEYAYANLGRSLWGLKRYDEAIAKYKKQIEIVPLDRYAHRDLGRLYADLKRYEEAAAFLERAVSVEPKDALAWESLARVRLLRDEPEAAVAAFARSVELSPTSRTWLVAASALADKGVALDVAERYVREAIAASAKTLASTTIERVEAEHFQATSRLAGAWDTLGWIYFKRGDLAAAERWLRAAWLLAQDPRVGEHLAIVSEKLGNRQAAVEVFAQALAIAPQRAPLRQALERLVGAGQVDEQLVRARQMLVDQRTIKLPRLVGITAAAEVSLIVEPSGRVASVRFENGHDALRGSASGLIGVKVPVLMPDGQQAHLLRRAGIGCSTATGCELVLVRPADVRSASER